MENTAINMISHFSITAFMVIFSLFSLSDYGLNTRPDSLDTIQFKHNIKLKLSEDGRVALHKLIKSKSFSYTRLGAGGKFSSEYNNFAILMQEGNSIEAFIDIGT